MTVAIQVALLVVFGVLLAYLAWLSLLAFIGRTHAPVRASRVRRFAILVPAHNEEPVIDKTLRSLLAIDYPRDAFDVIVVADNCSDGTAEVARSLGAVVHERHDPTLRGKGYALRWCFDRLLTQQPGYDAIGVVDADSVVSGNFLTVINAYLEQGAQAIQCSDLIESQPGVWNAEVPRIGLMLYNYVRPLGRRVIGCSAGLRGNGMCFAADTLCRVPWDAYSLTEDLEYGLVLLLNGITVVFAPEATVLSPLPHSVSHAETQRARWETGRLGVIHKYAGRLLSTAFRRASFKALDACLDLVTPPFVNMMIVVLIMLGLSLLQWAVGMEPTGRFVWLWLLLVGLGVFHVVVGLSAAGADRLMYKAFIYFPRYALWKGIVYMRLLGQRQTQEWVRTTRDAKG